MDNVIVVSKKKSQLPIVDVSIMHYWLKINRDLNGISVWIAYLIALEKY